MTVEPEEDRFLTRREAEILISQNEAFADERKDAHRREHDQEREAVMLAVNAAKTEVNAHGAAHDRNHTSHEEKHHSEGVAVTTALAAVARERSIHAEAHERDHIGHQREHGLNNLAIDKAESATDKRFSAANAYKEQINDMVRTLASRESVEVLIKEVDRRFDESRKDIERRAEETRRALATLERTDVKADGLRLGQGAIVTYIVTAVGLVGGVLGIIIILSNVLT